MPLYSYENTETGETWTEFRTMAQRLDGVDGKKIILCLTTPKQTDPSLSTKRAQDFSDKVLQPMKKWHPGIK